MSLRIKVERIRELLQELEEFDKLSLKDVELTENDEVIPISAEILEEWKFIGLTNTFFVEFEFWKTKKCPETKG